LGERRETAVWGRRNASNVGRRDVIALRKWGTRERVQGKGK